jgi:hypothetical protein
MLACINTLVYFAVESRPKKKSFKIILAPGVCQRYKTFFSYSLMKNLVRASFFELVKYLRVSLVPYSALGRML